MAICKFAFLTLLGFFSCLAVFAAPPYPITFYNLNSKPLYLTFYNTSGEAPAAWGPGCTPPLAPGARCDLTVGLVNTGSTRFCVSPEGPQNCNHAQDLNLTMLETNFDDNGIWVDISVIPRACTPEMWEENKCMISSQAGFAAYNIPLKIVCSNVGYPPIQIFDCRGPSGKNNFPINCGVPNGPCLGAQTGDLTECNQAYFYPTPDFEPVYYCKNFTAYWLDDELSPAFPTTTSTSGSSLCISEFSKSTQSPSLGYVDSLINGWTFYDLSHVPSHHVHTLIRVQGWLDNSTSPIPVFFNDQMVHSGNYSIMWIPNQNTLNLRIPPFSPNQWNILSFWINGATGNQKLNVTISSLDSTSSCQYDFATFYGGPMHSGWTWVGIPFSSFGMSSASTISGFLLSDASDGQINNPLWIDDVQLQSLVYNGPSGSKVKLQQVASQDTTFTIQQALAQLTGQPASRFSVKLASGFADVQIEQLTNNPVPAEVLAAFIVQNFAQLQTRSPVASAMLASKLSRHPNESGMIAGIVIGVLLAILIIAAVVLIVVFLIFKQMKKRNQATQSKANLLPSTSQLAQALS